MTTSAELATLPKNELADRLARVERRHKLAQEREENTLEKAIGHGSAFVGGALGAITKRYLPQIIPGDTAGDSAAVFGVGTAIDLAGILMRGELATQVNYIGCGFDGYILGRFVEDILP